MNERGGTAQVHCKERPDWAVGCGPDWRIVTNGKRYRVEHRVEFDRENLWEEWEPVMDECPDCQGHVFETRLLWLARWRLRKESDKCTKEISEKIAEATKPKSEWTEVER